jgi:hypothetical protein
MANVIANARGFFGGVIREEGERFVIPDELWKDEKRRPSWVRLAKAAPAPEPEAGDEGKPAGKVDVPADWQNLHAAEMKALAKAISGENAPNKAEAEKIVAAYVEANAPEPFSDAPAPVHVKNEINAALGSTQPDWVDPGSSAPKPVAD